MAAAPELRVIAHLDLDCFYAQVEICRLAIHPTQPVAVQQWDSLIAVNYPARDSGVKRSMKAVEALAVCPGLKLVHVETLDEHGPCSGPVERSSNKVSLARYRTASAQVFQVLLEFVDEEHLEKASIDEAFLDMTEIVERRLADSNLEHALALAVAQGWKVVGGTWDPKASELDRRLLVAAQIAADMRSAVFQRLGFTTSVGIAHNKMLAKLASPLNKPSNQAIVPMCAVPELMPTLPLTKLRFLGGKLGQELADAGYTTCGSLQAASLEELCAAHGDKTGPWLYNVCRGVDNSRIRARLRPKSMAVCKSFPATSSPAELDRWLRMLVVELADRMREDAQLFRRVPRKLSLHYARSWSAGRSKSCPVPPSRDHDSVLAAARQLLQRCIAAAPFVRLSLVAHSFSEGPRTTGAITAFFSTKSREEPADASGSCHDSAGSAEAWDSDGNDAEAQASELEDAPGDCAARGAVGIMEAAALGRQCARDDIAQFGRASLVSGAAADALGVGGGAAPALAASTSASSASASSASAAPASAVTTAVAPPVPQVASAALCPVCGADLTTLSNVLLNKHVDACLAGPDAGASESHKRAPSGAASQRPAKRGRSQLPAGQRSIQAFLRPPAAER